MNNVTDNLRNIREIKLRQYRTAEGQIYNLQRRNRIYGKLRGAGPCQSLQKLTLGQVLP